eukprot:PhM_4_TR17491/c1_g1_i2/m.44222
MATVAPSTDVCVVRTFANRASWVSGLGVNSVVGTAPEGWKYRVLWALENTSLLVISITLNLGLFYFEDDSMVTPTMKDLITGVIFVVNLFVFVAFAKCIATEVRNELFLVLDEDKSGDVSNEEIRAFINKKIQLIKDARKKKTPEEEEHEKNVELSHFVLHRLLNAKLRRKKKAKVHDEDPLPLMPSDDEVVQHDSDGVPIESKKKGRNNKVTGQRKRLLDVGTYVADPDDVEMEEKTTTVSAATNTNLSSGEEKEDLCDLLFGSSSDGSDADDESGERTDDKMETLEDQNVENSNTVRYPI